MTTLDTSVQDVPLLMILPKKKILSESPLHEDYQYETYKEAFKEEWIQLQMEVGLFDTMDQASEKADLFFEDPEIVDKKFVFVTDKEGKLVASCGMWPGTHLGSSRERLHYVAVKESHQHKGIAKAMMTQLVLRYESAPTKYPLYLATQSGSYGAIALYSRLGFIPYLGEYPGCTKKQNEKNWQIATDILKEKANG